MAPPPAPSGSSTALKAAYKSPSGDKGFSHNITAATALGLVSEHGDQVQFSKAKTAYLSEIRSSVKKMQGDINAFLTARMDEDKKIASSGGAQTNGKRTDEVEEEKYGGEDVEED